MIHCEPLQKAIYINYLIVCWETLFSDKQKLTMHVSIAGLAETAKPAVNSHAFRGALLVQDIQVQLHVFGGRYVLRVVATSSSSGKVSLNVKRRVF